MKILILTNFDVGLYQFRRELIARLLEDHQVAVSLPYGDLVPRLQEMGCEFFEAPVDRRGTSIAKDLKLFFYYCRLIRSYKPDLVITYTIKPNVYGGMACRLTHTPYAANITGLGTAFEGNAALRTFAVFLYRLGLKKAKCVFFENQDNQRVLLDHKLVKEFQCKLLSGAGVNLEHYRVMPYPDEDKPTHFLFVGRIMHEKGVDELFEAMDRLITEGEDCCLDILGDYEDSMQKTVEAVAQKGWLHYYGFQTDVRPYITDAHCFVLPSWHEGMANTNLECAATGRPVITCDIPGCREAVIDGRTGFLCQPKNVESLYSCMKHFLSLSRTEKIAMGLAGRKHMEEGFDKKKVVEETMKGLFS